MSITRCDDIWTAERFADAIGRDRPAWVELVNTAELAILIKVVSEAILVRHVAPRGGYHWTTAAALRRREDCDGHPEPAWLQQARISLKPPLILHDLLTPTYSQRALEARADGDRVASLDPVTRGIFEEAARLGRTSARHAVDPWLVSGTNSGYPVDWPRCVACGAPVLEGHLTCGRVECGTQADAARQRGRR